MHCDNELLRVKKINPCKACAICSTYVSIIERVLESTVRGTLDVVVCMGIKLADMCAQAGQSYINCFEDFFSTVERVH